MSFRCTRSRYEMLTGVALLAATAVFHPGGVALGGPASLEPFTATQPDGSTFVAVMGGDEWFNWYSHEGVLIVQDDVGWWRYAREVAGTLEPGFALVAADAIPADAVTVEDVPRLAASVERPKQICASPASKGTRVVNHAVLIILVEFQDRTISTSDAYWSNLILGTSGNTVRTYFDEVSAGNLALYEVGESYGTFGDSVVRVQLQSSDHYGGNHPNPGSTIDDRNRWIVYDALYRADPYVPFDWYDSAPANGYITPNEMQIVFVVAGYERGYGDASTPAVFGHRWALGFGAVPSVQCDGKTLCTSYAGYPDLDSGYMQVGELHGDHAGTMGELCHEFGHDLGLPDLYDTTYASSGIGGHGLMGYGGWGKAATDTYLGETPTHLCAWSKQKLGYVTPQVVSAEGDYALIGTGSPAYNVLRINTSDANQYFLIENRQLEGFDAGLYRWFSASSGGGGGGGMAAWHVDESMTNNNNPAHKKVDLEEANQGSLGYSELDTLVNQGNRHHYFYAGHVGDFGDATTPNSRLYSGSSTNINVSSISVSDDRMKCYVAVSREAALVWSTYLNMNAPTAEGPDVAIDNSENVYVTGATATTQFVVRKFNTNGSHVWSYTVDGGTACAIAVDGSGCAYVTGHARESWFPTTVGAYDRTFAGGQGIGGDAFVAKLAANGASLAYSTFLGGSYYFDPYTLRAWSGADLGLGIAVDSSGQAVVTGMTDSRDFPNTVGSAYGLDWDGFVTRLNSAGSGLLYSRYLAEAALHIETYAEMNQGFGVAYDSSGNAWVTGYTWSDDFAPVTGAPSGYDKTFSGGGDAFVVKVATNGTIPSGTFLGGSQDERGLATAVDALGYPYATGWTSSTNTSFPLMDAYDSYNFWQTGDAYITVFNPAGTALAYSTFFGGYQREDGYAVEVDSQYNMYLAGVTESDDLQVSAGAPYATRAGGRDGFVARLNADGATLDLGTYLGGSSDDEARGMAVGASGAIYVAGRTQSSDFPTTPGAYDDSYNGTVDGFLTKIAFAQVTESLVVGSPDGGEAWYVDAPATIRWSSSGAGSTVKIELSRDGNDGPWETLYASTTNDGVEDWTVSGTESDNCYIRITDTADASLTDVSNTAFSIVLIDCELADAPQAEQPTVVAKNRYLTFVPGNVGVQTALRVSLTDLPVPFEAFEGCQLFVGAPFDLSEVAGKADATSPTFKAANLQTEPYCMDWGSIPLLHVFDNEIVPNGAYAVQAIDCLCDFGVEMSYSAALSVGSSRWGDIVGDNNSQPPNGTVNFVDISCVVDKFKNLPGAPMKSRTDVSPDVPDRIVDFGDIPSVVDAFRGVPYPYSGPDECE